ncbi:HIT family protein [Tersicoccus solisilvae]|uniref:HIT family protein n=1 Tax=Tersicoccus solisilvae TaxID=1882339 RepID=A0ABQ1P6Y1_9MICC|nr:HIT family protein [Tersicoccus solisilvae]GGC92267.1 HIT family protein [Tersicoccus solisilvae]
MTFGRPKPPQPGTRVTAGESPTGENAEPTLFTRIIDGQIPGDFVWKDDAVVVFLSIGPLADGHALVVPRAPVDAWTDLPADLMARVMEVAQIVGKAQLKAFDGDRIGVIIAGFEIPHTHVHVFPATSEAQFDFTNAGTDPDMSRLAANGRALRAALRAAGHEATVPAD